MQNQTPDFPLTNIHEAMTDSKLAKETDGKMDTFTYKALPETKKSAEEICKANGTTLSGFIRSCLKSLVKDYNPTARE